MKKFKGYLIPRSDKTRPIPIGARNTRQHACYRSNMEDCLSIGGDARCLKCLFFNASSGKQKEAFNEWLKAKGKVKYD